jgi:hypothetical protein
LHDLIPEYERQLGNKVQVNYGNPAVTLERLTKGDPETGIKIIAAVHSQCRSWVNRCVSIQRPGRSLSAVRPIATISRLSSFVREGPTSDNAPQQTASLFDHLVGAGE